MTSRFFLFLNSQIITISSDIDVTLQLEADRSALIRDSNHDGVLHAKSKRNLFNNADVIVGVITSTLDFVAMAHWYMKAIPTE